MRSRQGLYRTQADHDEALDEPLIDPLPEAEAEGSSDTLPASQPLSTALLLAGRSAVTIEHQGVHYVLRATRSGKLILTK